MSFQSNKFLGLTCQGFKTSIGWNQSFSTLTVDLVEDQIDGDLPEGVTVGTPVYFSFGSFSFAGLLQKFGKVNSTSILPGYQAIITDPREILDGAQVITSGYSAAIPTSISNLYNIFGYWESFGFGTSGVTSAGAPWAKVLTALTDMINSPAGTAYGDPLTYKGYSYSLDISELPRPPSYYRLPTGYISILDIINSICADCGCDYFIELVGLTIKIRVVSRFFQPPLGTVASLALSGTYSGSIINSEAYVESRNEVTSIFLTGGEKTGVDITTDIYSYWGTDINGIPITGVSGTLSDLGTCEFADLNAADCADIVGSTTYNCSTFEMRFALWGVESWTAFINKYRTDISTFIGAGIYGEVGAANPKFAPDIIPDGATHIADALDETLSDRRARLFDLVRKHAEEFYGKQFLVTMTGLEASQDSETGEITTSVEPTNAGYLEFGAAGIGVPANRLDILQEADERVVNFAYYANILGADTSNLNWGDVAVDNTGKMWTKSQVANRILFIPGTPPTPYLQVRLSGALFEVQTDKFGDASLAGKVFALTGTDLQNIDKNAIGGSIGFVGIHPAARYPTSLGIALKSNVEVYGPWFIAGPPGKVRVEQDSTLTPWDYGSAAVMELAGNSRVLNGQTNQQASESGGLTVAGAPSYSLGATMATGGPNLTNIEVSYSPNGVTTSYRFETFTPRFGITSRQNLERIRRISLAQVQHRRDFRKALNRAIVAGGVIDRAKKGAKFNKAFWEKKQSPHTIIMAQGVTSGSDTRTGAGFETNEAAIAILNQDNYADKAIMSVTGLVRGFSTNPSATTKLSKYDTVGSFAGTNTPITLTDLNPFQSGNDVEILTWGDTYAGCNAYRRGNTTNNTRAIALRGPLVISGWGVGTDGNKYPSGSGSYASNYLKRSDLWMTAPVDLLYDPVRKVWTAHDIMSGVTSGSTASGANGTVLVGNDAGWSVSVYNQWTTTIATAKKCLIGYCVNENRWQFLSVDC